MAENKDEFETMDVLGATGLKSFGGKISEEFLPDLRGNKAVKVYSEMAQNDPVIGAVLYAIRTLVRQVDWTIREADDTPEAKACAEFVSECLFDDMEETWSDTLSEILSFLVFGFSTHEITYKIRRGPEQEDKRFKSRFKDNRIGWRGFPIRSQESLSEWDIDETDGAILGFYQDPPPNYDTRYIPKEKMLLFRSDAHKGNPEGRSILRSSFVSYYYKKKIQTLEGVAISRDVAGIPTLEVPLQILSSNASSGEKAVLATLKDLVQRAGREEYEGLVIPHEQMPDGSPSGYRLKLLSSGGRRPIDVNEIIKRYESRIAMSMLGEFILLGSESVGSFALADSKTALFAQALGTYLDSISSIINNEAIPRLMKLNNFPEACYPKLAYDDIETPDLAALSSSLASLVGAGVLTPDDKLEEWVREHGNLPATDTMRARMEPEPEADVLQEQIDQVYGEDDADRGAGIESGEEKPGPRYLPDPDLDGVKP